MTSVLFAAGSCAALVSLRWATTPMARSVLLICAGVGIGLRLLANLFDGMVAVEGGMKTPAGEIYNDLPDRLSDLLILVGAGYSVAQPAWAGALGWLAGMLAVGTAYVRVLGGSAGLEHWFSGPMAKPHRMAVIIVACVAALGECWWNWRGWSLLAGLGIVAVGCVITILRRTRRIIRELNRA